MSQFDNIQKVLEDFKNKVISEARNNLKSKGKLNNSLRGFVKQSRNSIQLTFEMESYGAFVDKGVKGNKSSNKGNRQTESPYKFGTNSSLIGKAKGGMSGIMTKWVKQKGFQFRDKQGRFMSYKSMGYTKMYTTNGTKRRWLHHQSSF